MTFNRETFCTTGTLCLDHTNQPHKTITKTRILSDCYKQYVNTVPLSRIPEKVHMNEIPLEEIINDTADKIYITSNSD